MVDYKGKLDALVDRLLAGEVAFEEFQRDYSRSFIDELPDSALSAEEWEVYRAIHEKAEWTSAHPSPEERGYGWLNTGEFLRWLRLHRPGAPSRGADPGT